MKNVHSPGSPRGPPDFLSKYTAILKGEMKLDNENQTPRAWLYARIPGNYVATQDSLEVCRMRAEQDGCQIAGSSTDLHGTWHFRPGYRSMMQKIKQGKIDRVYICRMRQVSGKERHLITFFKRLMRHGVHVTATEYDLPTRVGRFRMHRKLVKYSERKRYALPWQ